MAKWKYYALGAVGGLIIIGTLVDEPAPESVPTPAIQPDEPTQARAWAETVRNARLDQTTINQFFAQMPEDTEPGFADGIVVTDERMPSGGRTQVTWTFEDGSYIMADFKPVPGPDMVLNYVEIDER